MAEHSHAGASRPHWTLSTLLLWSLWSLQVWAHCRILKCNSEFVAATLDLGGTTGGGGALGGAVGGGHEDGNAGYCSALRSYALCTRRTAHACRGDLAYHSAAQGIEDLLIQNRCPRVGPTAQPRPLPQGPLSGEACHYDRAYLQRGGRPPEYLHCAVFGDPHVRTFGDEFHTCAVAGAWPLVDNEFLYIQATSSPLRTGARGTVLSKITAIFKNRRECAEQQIYQAELGNVPPAFVDGSVSSGYRRGPASLRVRSSAPGRQAEIWAAHIGTRLVVRESGGGLVLSLRSPQSVVASYSPEQDLQLCVWGCPASQRLQRAPEQGSSAAHEHCAALLPTRDVYFQACVYDVMATGDLNASAPAVAALEDARSMLPYRVNVHLLSARAGGTVPGLAVMLATALLTQALRTALLQLGGL